MTRAGRVGALLLVAGMAAWPSAWHGWPAAGRANPGAAVVADRSPARSFLASATHWLVAARLTSGSAGGSSPVALTGVACPAGRRCVAVGGGHVATEGGGPAWHFATVPARTGYLTSVACPSPTRCLAVAESTGTGKSALVIASDDGGRSWRVAYAPAGSRPAGASQPASVVALAGIACPSPARCIAVGTGEDPAHPHAPAIAAALLTDNGGRTWRAATLPSGLAGLDAVSCASASQCAATGWLERDNRPVATTTTDGGVKWYLRSLPASIAGTDAITCPTVAVCYVAGFEPPAGAAVYPGAVVVSGDGGRKWVALRLPHDAGPMNAVTCVDASRCIAVGIDSLATAVDSTAAGQTAGVPGIVIATANGGRSFAVAKLPKGVRGLAGVACDQRRSGAASAGWPVCDATAADGHRGSLILASLPG